MEQELKSVMIKEQIAALEAYRKQLKEKHTAFLKVSGIAESTEQYKGEVSRLEASLEIKKEELYELKATKQDAVKDTLIAIQDRITRLLPQGDGIVHIEDDGSFVVGWMLPNRPLVPFAGLSGGQTIVFGRALSSALMGDAKNKILVYEAAEVDPPNLKAMLGRIEANTDDDTQVIVNTWFQPEEVSGAWTLINF
ncbi:MAG: hypothetical protein BBJ57_07295 [Desulfobacterales bacterium PC51MH44]|nr:MAG: hypothetical protein BBJ57_07295 [Desulfobacterales bacterium PC51MH44]